jgi:catechol 2,3-dioxygenase-like lactoylglutathione lyase family enzyme
MGHAGVFKHLDTVIVRVRDLDRARAWYQEKLGLAALFALEEPDRLVVMDAGRNLSLTLWELRPGEEMVTGGQLATYPVFSVEDIHATHRLLTQREVRTTPVERGEAVLWFLLYDLDGNAIEACQPLAG